MPTWSNTMQNPPSVGGTGLQSLFKRPATGLFLLALPFSYVPRLVEGDTQPWPLLAVLILFLMNRSAKTMTRLDLILIGSVLGAMLVFFARAGFGVEMLRFGYKMFVFTLLWVCVPALPVGLVVRGMKSVILIWFLFGMFQTLALQLGISIEIGGRFVEGRSGVPSLAPEPSLFGILSLLALYYLVISKQKISPIYHAMAFANVFMSGSILAILAGSLFILLTPWRVRILFALIAVPLVIYLLNYSEAFFLNRIQRILSEGLEWRILLLDYSINLRVGHVVYTLWSSFPAALMLQTVPDFETAYNSWAKAYRPHVRPAD